MGATASSAQRDSRCEEDAAAEELTAAASDAQDDGAADDKLLQKNGQISSLNVKTRNHADELNGNFEERVLADVGSGFVALKEDGTETTEDLQEMDALQPVTKNESTEMVNADSVTVKEETVEDNQVNDINEVGFKKIFRFVGFKFTLKKDTCEKTESDEQEEKVASPSEDSSDTQENSAVAANENTPDETRKSEVSSQSDGAEHSQQTDNEKELDQDIKIVEHHVEDTPEKELEKEGSPEPEEPMSPIKQFFTQGIFASLRKKKKEEEMQKESKEEELKRIERMGVEEAEKEDSKCICLDISYITSEEEKDSQEKDNDKLLPEGELQNSLEKDKVQGSPLKRLFRKFSTRRQRECKAAEKVIEAEEQVSEQPKPSSELTELAKVEEPVVVEPKTAEEELMADVSPQQSKKKSDTTASWEALICGGTAKKRARNTNEDETLDKGEEYEKTTDSPLGSSTEGDYDHLTSSNEQTGSPAEGEMGSTWKTFKKIVTPKRKVRTGESSTPEQIPSDSEMNKDEPFSMKKLIPGHKKRKSDARKDDSSSNEASKDHETGDEDDETPAIIPLSEYEIIEPETKVPINIGPTVIHGLSEDFEEFTDFNDTFAEDIVELTADAVTAPEPSMSVEYELWTDEFYEAEIKQLKTEYQEVIVSEKESVIETELSVEQVIQLVAEPLVGESEETHMEKQREECTTGIELRHVIGTMQSEAGLEQVISDYTHGPETECPLHSVLEEPVYDQPVAAEPEKELTLSDVELSIAKSDQPASTKVVDSLTHGDIDRSPGTTTSKEVKEIEINASAVECLEITETDSIISPISDHIQAETLELEGSLKLEAVESIHVDACEIHFDVKDAVLLAGDSAVTVEDISGKIEEKDYEKMAQQDIKEIHVEEETGDDVASEAVKNIQVENISDPGDESLARKQLPVKEVSEPVLVEEAEELHKEEIKIHLDDKVEDSGTDRTDGIFVKEEEEHAVNEGQPLTNTDSNKTPTDESPETIVDAGSEIGDMVCKIREHTVVSAFSKDVAEHTETPEEPGASSEVILKPLEIVLPEVAAKPVATEIAQPATMENIKTGKVLEMVAIIENTTKQSGKEKPMVSEPVTQVLAKSKLPKPTEQDGEEIDGEQTPAMTLSEMKETPVPEEKDTMAVVPKPEPEGFNSGPTMIEVPTITVLAQNYTAAEIEVSNMSEKRNEEDENAGLKCEPLEQVTEKILSNELQLDKTEIKDEIPAVMEKTPIAQESPLTSEVTAKMPEVAVSEIQSQVVSELRAETLEVTEPKVEIPVVSEVKVETAIVTELEVETPVVTSVAKELEVGTPVVTSMANTTDTHNSAVTLQNQNIDSDTSVLTTVTKEQVVEIPTVISVVVTPATPLDEVTPVVTLGNESKDVPSVKETPVETPNVESVIVRTAVVPVVEIQNVIPVVATPDLGSVIVTEAATPVVSTGTVTTTLAEAPVVSTVVETPVFSITAVKSTPAAVEKTVVSPVVEIPATVTSVVETPAVVSVEETVPPEEVTLHVTSFAETPVQV
ncbi:hypothetical protein cypCar_00011663 [Cyprinus carpio]|nr:hypothetical protein cypCar_00011663 [Cyprinus carpio]